MKKMTIISMMALLVLCASCKKDKEQNTENSNVCFSATVENHSANGKTILNDNQVLWEKGDEIKVTSSTSTEPVTFTAGNAGAKAKFYAESVDDNFVKPNSVYTAFYGNIEGNTLTLPSSQNYVANSFGSGENPMAAVSAAGETKLPFKNICGFLELKLYAPASTAYEVSSITLKQTGATLWGTGEVSISDGIPSLGALSGGSDELTLNCGDIPLSDVASQPTTFHFVVPVGTLGGSFTVTMTTKDGAVWSKTATNQTAIARNDMKSMAVLKAEPAQPIPTGALSGKFSVAAGKQVYFSKGNLQFIGSASPTYWKFADNQYDYLSGQATTSQSVNRDLFGWGTSGYNHNNLCYQPWSTSQTNSDYYAYKSYSNKLSDGSGKADWGYNKIKNGGDTENMGWRTLSGGDQNAGSEWEYLISKRGNYKDRRALGRILVNTVYYNGLILLPDVWALPNGCSFTSNVTDSFITNTYTSEQWDLMEAAGAVFLPAAGIRTGTSISGAGSSGIYWSSAPLVSGTDSPGAAYNFEFSTISFSPTAHGSRCKGRPVRLVIDVPANQ